MQPNDSRSRDRQRHELVGSLTVAIGYVQRLQRLVLRADGLGSLERDMMLDTAASVLASVRDMERRIYALGGDSGYEP